MLDKSLFSLPGVRGVLMMLALFACIQGGCVVGQALCLARAIANLWAGGALAAQVGLIAGFAACFAGQRIVVFLQDGRMAAFAERRAGELREALLQRVFVADAGIVRENGTASITASALEGTDQVQAYLEIILPKIVNVAAIPVIVLVAAFALDVTSAVIELIAFPVIIFYMVLLGRLAKARAERQYEAYHAMSNHFVDTLRGMDTLRAFGRSKAYGARIYRVSEGFREATVATLKVATLSSAVLDLIATAGIGAVALMLGMHLLDGTLTLFFALASLILAPEYFRPIREFANDYHASLDGKNALAAITRLIEGEPAQPRAQESPGAQDAPEGDKTDSCAAPAKAAAAPRTARGLARPSKPAKPAAAAASPKGPGAPGRGLQDNTVPTWSNDCLLELSHVSFAYPGDNNHTASLALDDVGFTARGFETIGLVGVSGAGKSTLASLLGGFAAPSSGVIRAGGVTLASLADPSWRRQVLYIPQHPYIFGATLRENLCFYTPEACEDDVRRAVTAVGLDGLVARLPQGLDTPIGEGGRGLSGGQAQRIALARALLDPSRRVLIFDEPTAHLDIETELELKERMVPLMEGRLVIFATHRLHWLANVNRVLVMEQGRIVQSGDPRELLAADGALAQLAARLVGGGAA